MSRRGRTVNVIGVLLILMTVFITGAKDTTVSASAALPGYKNPRDIVIAYPSENLVTTASRVSILGACNYKYKLTMNGEKIDTTEHGFFTVYVDLELGENKFIFRNHGKVKEFIITRKEAASGGGSSTPKYIEYDYKAYGVVTSDYLMPRMNIAEADLTKMPLTTGTTVSIIGEQGSYYKLIDNSFVSKSGIEFKKRRLKNNKVSKAVITDNTDSNCLQTVLTMNINAMHNVEVMEDKLVLTLYGTISAKKAVLAENDTVSAVKVKVDKEAKTVTYTYKFHKGATICGYDVRFDGKKMYFTIKKAPHLEKKGSLKGAVVLVDAGHGDDDRGTKGPMGDLGPNEKDINLRIAKLLREYLTEQGAKVVMTRTDDTFYSLSYRVNLIRSLKPDLSISIHGNAMDIISDFSKSSGFLAYYSYDILHGVCDYLNESVSEKMDFEIRPTRQRSLSLTRVTICPAVLMETKFLSYPEDYEYLIKAKNQQFFADSFGEAIKEYLESIAVYAE